MAAPESAPLPVSEQHRLIRENRPLVIHLAKGIGCAMPLEDRIAWGDVGMVEAARRFDPQRGVKFSSYAAWWVRALILRASVKDAGAPDTRHGRRVLFGLRRAIRNVERAGLEPTNERVAEKLQVPLHILEALRTRMLSADADCDDKTLAGKLADRNSPETEFAAAEEAAAIRRRLEQALQCLMPREREVLQRRFLADNLENLQEVADSWGVSRQRADQIEKRAMRKLKKFLTSRRRR